MNTYGAELIQHYRKSWNSPPVALRWEQGPVHELPKDFCVLGFRPTKERNMWTYATSGMSQPQDKRPIELHLFSPVQDELLVELLTVTVHYHRTGSPLGLEHTVNFGRPWLPHSKCSYGLISLPYLDGPKLEKFESRVQKQYVHCLWLIPITEAEREFKKASGMEALEEKFEAEQFNYADPKRNSVV